MNYTKFLKKDITNDKFVLIIKDEKIEISMNIFKDIKKTSYIIKNYNKFDSKFDLDEFFALFLQDKNAFITEFKEYIEKSDNKKVTKVCKKNYLTILEILKNQMDELLKDYKNTKQLILKKLKNKENFWKSKEKFIKNFTVEETNTIYNKIPGLNNITNVIKAIPNPISTNLNHISNFAGSLGSTLKNTLYNQLSIENQTSSTSKINTLIEDSKNLNNINKNALLEKDNKSKLDSIAKIIEMKNINKKIQISNKDQKEENKLSENNANNSNQNYNPYEESSQTLSLLKKEDTTDLDRTRKILFELSDLMTNFSMKVQQHHEMTQQIMNLSTQSVDNINKANKELKISQEYQKGRGLMIGLIFIILGVFLLYYDYAL